MTAFARSLFSKGLKGSLPWILSLSLHSTGQAAGWLDSFQYQGFIGQGLVITDDNNFYGSSSNGSLAFRELGLNASIRPSSQLQLAGQLLSRRAGETDNGDIRIDYALADYSLHTNGTSQAGIRLGKIKNPLGLYNETRDVPFTRPSIFLPQGIYFDRTRELALTATGGQFYADHNIGDNLLSLQLSVGILEDKDLDYAILGINTPGDFESEVSYAARLLFDNQQGLLVGLTYAIANLYYKPGAADPFSAGNFSFKPLILSLQYDAGRWELTSELASRPIKLNGLGPPADTNVTGQSAYLQGIFRFDTQWQGLLRYDAVYIDKNDRDGNAYATATGRPAHSRFAKDWTIGLRWIPAKSWMIGAEFHHVDGTAWLAAQDNPKPTEQRWNMFSSEVSYRF